MSSASGLGADGAEAAGGGGGGGAPGGLATDAGCAQLPLAPGAQGRLPVGCCICALDTGAG